MGSVAYAAGGSGSILSLSIQNGTNFALVTFAGVLGGAPTCQNQPLGGFGFDVSTAKGKALLSLLESAYLAGKTIGYGGSGACLTVGPNVSVEAISIATMPGS
jgi:hypothetical protein